MMVAMIASVSATDYVFEYNFEDDVEGDWIAIDRSINVAPKQFSIQVAKFDGTMCMKFDRTGYVEGAGDKDCFSDLFGGGSESVWGLGPQFVLSYDIYFEKLTTGDNATVWQVGMLRMTPPAGTQFQQSFTVIGNQIVEYDKADQPLMEIQEGKWYNFAVAFDMKNQCFSMYVDGDLIAKDLDWNCADTSATEAERIRIAWNGGLGDASGDGIAYVDNFKAYNADKPENATGKTIETSAPATEAPATEAPATEAPATGAVTTPAPSGGSSTATADIAVVIAAVAAVAASGAIIVKKKH
ncbi:MAG: hypothetical protein ACI3XP_02395, partial [Eubacteriales bacterium]